MLDWFSPETQFITRKRVQGAVKPTFSQQKSVVCNGTQQILLTSILEGLFVQPLVAKALGERRE